ncbi:HlyD family secretion protein [Planctomycetes bacterium CA13]|uniref:HlyD family secretion protein n=1 Tax=Novipirellula herctigrandis TaxID=2527986 RepID=A0A5C5YY74_9BACT|nr:HlyD family secretion protein [Planctomycetes bacterium CA13]
MNANGGFESFSTESMLHVSLTGNTDLPLPAAPTMPNGEPERRAVDKTKTDPSPPEQLAKLFEIIRAIALTETRNDSVRVLTQELASRFPESKVRCGIGDNQLKRLFDHRLGWLGPESGPREQATKQWEQLDLDTCAVLQSENSIVLCLPSCNSAHRCVVWITPVTQSTVFAEWLRTIDTTLAAVFWSRPNRTAPKAIRNLTRRTMMIGIGFTLILGLLALWPVHYRIACNARVESLQQRLVAAPFEAVLLSSHVRPGESVKAGDVLASLDGRPLRLERESIDAEIQQASKEHDTALATGRIADAQQAKLRQRQLTRSFDLLSDRLGRLEVVSPIDGIVISGDLNQYVGAPLELGQTIFEISPMDRLAIEVEIPAHEIGYVTPHAPARVRFVAISGKSMQVELDDVYPAAEIREDENVFIGRVEIQNEDGKLRPGMQGDATTYGPVRPWIWSWVRGKVERVLWWVGY